MRKVINILQSTSLSYPIINSESVIKCTGYINNEDIKRILSSLINDSFSNSASIITKIKKSNSYALIDIISEISDIIIKVCGNTSTKNKFFQNNSCAELLKNVNKLSLLKILDGMCEIEANLSSCTNDDIQTAAFIGIFNKYLIKNKLNIK